jgi:hypothetical protein
MQSTQRLCRFRIPAIFVGVHTLLVLVAFGLGFFYGHNDSGPAYVFAIAVMYLLDLPIGLLCEALRLSLLDYGMRITVFLSLYLFLGGALWFCIGLGASWIARRLRPKRY